MFSEKWMEACKPEFFDSHISEVQVNAPDLIIPINCAPVSWVYDMETQSLLKSQSLYEKL